MTSNRPVVFCVGEVLWDCFPDGKVLGGAPFNCAFMLHALGAAAMMVSRVGDDADGKEILAIMESAGLERRYVQVDEEHATGRVEVSVSAGGEPTFTILEDKAWDHIAYDSAAEKALSECDAVCFGTLAQRNAASRQTILKMLNQAQRAVKVFDINLRQSWFSKDIISRGLSLATVVKLNNEELDVLKGIFPDIWQGGVKGFMGAFGVDLLAVTRGGEGCILYKSDEEEGVPGIKVPVQDTVGSGDAFTASLILSYLSGAPLRKIGEEANLLGAYVATQRGATPSIKGYKQEVLRYR